MMSKRSGERDEVDRTFMLRIDEQELCTQRETSVEQDEIDEQSLTSPDAGVLIFGAEMNCIHESE